MFKILFWMTHSLFPCSPFFWSKKILRLLCSKHSFRWALGIFFRRACFYFCNHSQGYSLNFLQFFRILHLYKPQSWTWPWRQCCKAAWCRWRQCNCSNPVWLVYMYSCLITHFIQSYFTSLAFALSEKLKINNFVLTSEPPVKKYILLH